MYDVLAESIIDTLKLFPFLFLSYLLIELFEHKTSFSNANVLTGKFAPLFAALTGIIPQCGFSVTASKLYDKSIIRTGTLLSVFIATSDEAIIILISNGEKAFAIFPLIAFKLIIAVAVGYIANSATGNALSLKNKGQTVKNQTCSHVHEGWFGTFVISPLYHALKTFFFVLAVNIAFGSAIYFIGEEKISLFLFKSSAFQPFLTALVGLIPNCASSVILTQTYILGKISFASLFSGLCTNAGVALIVLFKGKKIKKALAICVILYAVGVFSGLLLDCLSKIA